jgi:hypothetical protein
MERMGRKRDGVELNVRVEREAAPGGDLVPADETAFSPAWLLRWMEDAGVRLEPGLDKSGRGPSAWREALADPIGLSNVVTPREFAQRRHERHVGTRANNSALLFLAGVP